ncbi:unnamed protein product [Thlaspi arvense]|uniref:Uncharacterized protein n=1 Tax=Thlaspi arvense TaxID=13288 RepID=A0AAU9R4U1_THLAR|nr:unnamed protein product [Thlaspi arvense]
MTTPTYNHLLCIGLIFLQCFSSGFGRNLQDKLGATQYTPKHVEVTAPVTNSGPKDILSSIGLGEVISEEMHHIHIGTDPDSSLRNKQDSLNYERLSKTIRGTVSITFSFPFIKIPFSDKVSTVATINKLNEDKLEGIVITPTNTHHEFGLSLQKPVLSTQY